MLCGLQKIDFKQNCKTLHASERILSRIVTNAEMFPSLRIMRAIDCFSRQCHRRRPFGPGDPATDSISLRLASNRPLQIKQVRHPEAVSSVLDLQALIRMLFQPYDDPGQGPNESPVLQA